MPEHFLRVFEGKALAEELTKAGHEVSEKTVQRWKKGETRPKPQDLRAIRELVGATTDTTKEAPPAEAEGAFIQRWLSTDPPPWAQGLADQIIEEVKRLRDETVEAAVRAALDQAEIVVRGTRPPGEEAPETPGGSGAMRAQT